jgi:hypothetical protein
VLLNYFLLFFNRLFSFRDAQTVMGDLLFFSII